MNLIKTSFFTSISVTLQIIAGFFINKIVAVFVGPAGLAMIGQFQNFSQLTQSCANGGITQGVVKYVSEFRDDLLQKRKILSTAFIISLGFSIVIGVVLLSLRNYLAIKLLNDQKFSTLFVIFAFTIVLFALNTFLLAVLNAERDIKKYTLVNIATTLINLVLVGFLCVFYHLYGALFALVLNQSLVFFITLFLVIKSKWFRWKNFFAGIDKEKAWCLFRYSLMFVISATLTPLTQLFIRNYLGHSLSWDVAGYWQAVTKISDIYLLFITSTLTVYYLPRLAEINNADLLKKEILYAYKIIMPIAVLLALGIYLFRQEIVTILFAKQFLPMVVLFKYQLLGDVFKMGSWLLAYIMVAKAMTKLFIFSEILFSISLILLTVGLVNKFGAIGAPMAFAVNYLIYWVAVAVVYKNFLRLKY